MPDELTAREVWDSLVARADDPRATAIGERFVDAVEGGRGAAKRRDVVLRRYLGDEYDAVLRRTEGLEPEDAAHVISHQVMFRVADGDLSSANVGAIRDAISRIGELDLALGHAIERLRTAFEEAVAFLRAESHRSRRE